MSDLTTRIHRVTSDLQAIQSILDRAASPKVSKEERDSVMDEMLNTELINEFKASVDHMRLLLWSYIEAASSEKKQDISYKLQAVRMQRVTEMLSALKPAMEQHHTSFAPEAASFFEMVQSVAKATVDQHRINRNI